MVDCFCPNLLYCLVEWAVTGPALQLEASGQLVEELEVPGQSGARFPHIPLEQLFPWQFRSCLHTRTASVQYGCLSVHQSSLGCMYRCR